MNPEPVTTLARVKRTGRLLWNAKRIISLAVVALLLAQILVVAGYAQAATRSAPPTTDYGVYEALDEHLQEKESREGSVDELTEDRLQDVEDEIEGFSLAQEDIPQSPEFSEDLVGTSIQGVDVKGAAPMEPIVPDIFELVTQWTGGGTIFENLDEILANLTRYLIYTEYFPDNNSDGNHFNDDPSMTKWTSADLIPSIFNPSQGFKMDMWNGVNIDYDEETGDGDKTFFDDIVGSYEEGSDVWIQIRPVLPQIEALLADITNPLTALSTLTGFFLSGEINLTAGFMIQVKKDSWWVDREEQMPLHLAIVKGFYYDDDEFNRHEYIWTGDFNFTETPQIFNFSILVDGLSLDVSDVTGLVGELLGGAGSGSSAAFTSMFPPYTLRYFLLNNTNRPNDEANSIENLTILIGYEKFLNGVYSDPIDRTWVEMGIVRKYPQYEYIPRVLHVRLFGEKNIIKQLTEYDSITYYANIPANLLAIYSEEKENDTILLAEVMGLPGGDLTEQFQGSYELDPLEDFMDRLGFDDFDLHYQNQLAMRSVELSFDNISYRTPGGELVNKTLIDLNMTSGIDSLKVEGVQQVGGYLIGDHYDYYNISTEKVASDIDLVASFAFEDTEDPFTIFNNPDMTFLTQIVDNLMLTLASSIYAVGNKLRSLPDALSAMAVTGGNATLDIQNKVLSPQGKFSRYEDGFLGETFLAYAPGKYGSPANYARYLVPEEDNYFVGVYENLRFQDTYNRTGLSMAIGGIQSLYYKSEADPDNPDDLTRIYVSLNSSIEKPLEVIYLEGRGGDFQNQDFARLKIANNNGQGVHIPDRIRLELLDNITTIDFRDSTFGTIDSVFYESSLGGQYLRANISHVPEYLQIELSDTTTLFTTISEEDKGQVKNPNEYLDISLAASNLTRTQGPDRYYVLKYLEGPHVGIFKEGEEEDWTSTVSASFEGIKKVKYWTTEDGQIHTELRLNGMDRLSILLEDTIDYQDESKGLNGYLYLEPIPNYLRIDMDEVETEGEVEDVESEDFDDLADIAVVLDSFEQFTKSLLEVVDEGVGKATAGVGFSKETDWFFQITTVDPVTGDEANINIAGAVQRGDVDEMYDVYCPDYERTRWVNGISMRQFILDKEEERAIYDAKIYLAAPSAVSFEIHQHGDNINLTTSLRKFGTPGYDSMVIDVAGIDKNNFLLYMEGTKMKRNLVASIDLDINSTVENSTFAGNLYLAAHDPDDPNLDNSIELKQTYLKVTSKDEEKPIELRMLVPQVPTPIDLQLSITDDLSMDYSNSAPIDYMLLSFQMGDVSQLEERSEWTHGLSLREAELDDVRVMDGKIFMTGIPKETRIKLVTEGEDTDIELSLVDWAPSIDWFMVDIKGLMEKDFDIYLNGVPTAEPFDMDVSGQVFANASENKVESKLNFRSSHPFGSMYFRFRNPAIDEPMIIEAFVPEVPEQLSLHLILKGEVYIKLSSSQEIEFAYIKVARYIEGSWYDLVAIAHDVPRYLKAQILPNKHFDMDKTIILQGNPNILLESSSDKADVFITMDGKLNWAHGRTTLNIVDASNNTSIRLSEDFVYQIRTPGVGSALIIIEDLPVLKESHVNEIYIYAEDVRSVDIEARMLYGLYPIFKLSNADGGKVEVQVDITLNVAGRDVDVSAAVVDAQVNSLGPIPIPSIAPLYLNNIATSLSTDHFIIPEPVTTVVVTILKLFGGLF